jgi:hypothetical protein
MPCGPADSNTMISKMSSKEAPTFKETEVPFDAVYSLELNLTPLRYTSIFPTE